MVRDGRERSGGNRPVMQDDGNLVRYGGSSGWASTNPSERAIQLRRCHGEPELALGDTVLQAGFSGPPGRSDFAGQNTQARILNSRDHADPFGQPNVSRLIIGGTIAESGIETISVSESIDPGNFETAETGLILLDALSGSVAEWGEATFNNYITPASDKVRFVGTALGNIASHEAGHYLGNWHFHPFNDVLNLMDQGLADQGGGFPHPYGIGPDGVGGTADDPDVDFGEDILNEGFTGLEDTHNRTRWALAGPADPLT